MVEAQGAVLKEPPFFWLSRCAKWLKRIKTFGVTVNCSRKV